MIVEKRIKNVYRKAAENMDMNRAKQILSSSANIEVEYNGESIWIDDIKEADKTAIVHLLSGGTKEKTEVDIESLKEIH